MSACSPEAADASEIDAAVFQAGDVFRRRREIPGGAEALRKWLGRVAGVEIPDYLSEVLLALRPSTCASSVKRFCS